ncbi:MAG: hypothetical protein J6Q26_01150 [Bacteroidales bacterium]|nr:hypothetical protein [Bacteroidales bacterium]
MSNNIDKPKTQTKTPWQLVSMIGGAFGLIGLILLIISGIQNNKKSENASNEACEEEDPATYFLSIRTDTLHMEEGRVKNGASLSSILSSYGISMATIDKTARISKPVFDVRRLVSGHQYIALAPKTVYPA